MIEALKAAQQLLPFPLLGLDTDNGTEFINYALLEFCKENKITFTRSRAYKKNDQAHVEEKNGSIVRRLVGYDRYEGLDAYNALSELYAILRLYINFFQPSLKLLSKKRDGAKVTKKYDKAKTP
ncbi:MAG: transposase, partial [Chitinophagia bacterium]|nr:transposase [Chitinophagia bacterium]